VRVPPPFDKLYWFRIVLGAVAGILAKVVFTPSLSPTSVADYADGILVGMIFYLSSYYFARYVWYRKLDREFLSKLYTTAIGGFIMIFLFTWVLLFTLIP
jgi:hypothetical protein